jgi:hypothetical protein
MTFLPGIVAFFQQRTVPHQLADSSISPAIWPAVALRQKLLIVTAMSFDSHSNLAHNADIQDRTDSPSNSAGHAGPLLFPFFVCAKP